MRGESADAVEAGDGRVDVFGAGFCFCDDADADARAGLMIVRVTVRVTAGFGLMPFAPGRLAKKLIMNEISD